MKHTENKISILLQKDLQKIIPVIIQDVYTNKVLMLGFMNFYAYKKSILEKKVTFYSRSKKRLWTKGETTGNYLFIKKILIDCDQDTLLIKVSPAGPTCHKGTDTCWKESNKKNFLYILESIIFNRLNDKKKKSYVYSLSQQGINRITQKFGEESIEFIIESIKMKNKKNYDLFLNEAADVLFHYLILLNYNKVTIDNIFEILRKRNNN